MKKFHVPIREVKPARALLSQVPTLAHKHGIVLVYSPACPPCQAMAMEYQRFAAQVRGRIEVMAVNAQRYPQVFEVFPGILGTPTMFFVDRGGIVRTMAPHAGERTAKAMTQFVCSHITSGGACPLGARSS